MCCELHLKLNPDAASGAGAVLEVWQNDVLVLRFDDTGPLGFWIRDKFCPNDSKTAVCTTYRPANPTLVRLDQRWRATEALRSTTSGLRTSMMVAPTPRCYSTIWSSRRSALDARSRNSLPHVHRRERENQRHRWQHCRIVSAAPAAARREALEPHPKIYDLRGGLNLGIWIAGSHSRVIWSPLPRGRRQEINSA